MGPVSIGGLSAVQTEPTVAAATPTEPNKTIILFRSNQQMDNILFAIQMMAAMLTIILATRTLFFSGK